MLVVYITLQIKSKTNLRLSGIIKPTTNNLVRTASVPMKISESISLSVVSNSL